MNIVIIEDEPLLAEKLNRELLRYNPAIQVNSILGSIREALAYFQAHASPDLILSDIQLPDGLSFEIFQRLPQPIPVIFCTAFDEYALNAFKAHGVDYLLKPITSDALDAAMDKFQRLTLGKANPDSLHENLSKVREELSPKNQNSILVYLKDKIIPVHKDQVALVQVNDGLVYLHTFTGLQYPVNHKLDHLQSMLGDGFFRVNRQFIIHRKAVANVSQYFARKLLVHPTVKVDQSLVVSKANASHFLNWLQSH